MTTATSAPTIPGALKGMGRAVDYTWERRVILVIPLLLVNSVAVYGQYSWALTHLDDPGLTATLPSGLTIHVLPALFAGAMESVALYLQHEANVARLAGDPVVKLAAASYAVASVAGLLNFLHWHDRNLSAALAFGLLSTVSPWLWGIRSRSEHREQLRERGLLEERAVKFSSARWVLYPRATFRALRLAVWEGVQDPKAAVALLERTPTIPQQGTPNPTSSDGGGPSPSGDVGNLNENTTPNPNGAGPNPQPPNPNAGGQAQREEQVAWARTELARTPRPTVADIVRRGAQEFGVSPSTMERRVEAARKPTLVSTTSTG